MPQELSRIADDGKKDKFLNRDFTPTSLLENASSAQYSTLHIATHAEFARLRRFPVAFRSWSGLDEAIGQFVKKRKGVLFDLVVFSACRTASGDADAELGFSGLAPQAELVVLLAPFGTWTMW